MRVISSEFGTAMLFTSQGDLNGMIEQLEGFRKHIEESGMEPPFLYAVYHNSVPSDDVLQFLSSLKAHWPASEEDHEDHPEAP